MSGPDGSAQREAQQAERDRQQRISSTVSRINQVYDNPQREAEIGDYLAATRQYYRDDLDRQKGQTDRQLKFAMARNGQTGGSVAFDNAQRVGEEYTRGVLESDRRAQGQAADLRSQDEDSRLRLIQMAQAGLDATTASQQAASAQRTALQSARAAATADGLGDVFGSFADIYRRSQEASSERRGYRDYYNLFYQPGFGYGAPST